MNAYFKSYDSIDIKWNKKLDNMYTVIKLEIYFIIILELLEGVIPVLNDVEYNVYAISLAIITPYLGGKITYYVLTTLSMNFDNMIKNIIRAKIFHYFRWIIYFNWYAIKPFMII